VAVSLSRESYTPAGYEKFQRIIAFAEALPKLRATVAAQLRQQDLGRERVMASIHAHPFNLLIRPGSQVYASEYGSYGIATLRPKHVKVKGNIVEFDFPAKSGVRQVRQIKDGRWRRLLEVCSSSRRAKFSNIRMAM